MIIVTPDGLVFIINCNGDIISYDIGEPIHLSYMGYYSFEINNLMQYDPSIDADSFQSTAFELALDSPPPSALPNDNAHISSNKLYLIFISSVTNKLFLIQAENLLMKKLKFENIFTNQHALSANLKKNFQKHENKTIIQSIKYLLYNTKLNEPSSDFIDDEFDDANSNQIR